MARAQALPRQCKAKLIYLINFSNLIVLGIGHYSPVELHGRVFSREYTILLLIMVLRVAKKQESVGRHSVTHVKKFMDQKQN